MAFTEYPDGTEADKAAVAMEMALAAWERDRPDAPKSEDIAKAAEDVDNARKVRAKNAAAELALASARAKAWAENEVRVKAASWAAKIKAEAMTAEAVNEKAEAVNEKARAVYDKARADSWAAYKKAEAKAIYEKAKDGNDSIVYTMAIDDAQAAYKKAKAQARDVYWLG